MDIYANQAPQPTYREWLQDRYYNSSDPVVRQQASALLGVVGDDGIVGGLTDGIISIGDFTGPGLFCYTLAYD